MPVARIDDSFIPFLIAAMMFLFVVICFVIFYWFYVRHWVRSYRAKLNLSLLEIVSMHAQRIRPSNVIDGLIIAQESGFLGDDETLNARALAIHERQGGNAIHVVNEMREQRRLNKAIQTFEELATRQLASQSHLNGR